MGKFGEARIENLEELVLAAKNFNQYSIISKDKKE